MSLARYFDRAHTAIGGQFSIDRETLEGILRQRPVVVRLGRECSTKGNAQWTSNFLINLLARLYPALVLQGDDTACSNAESLARSINRGIEIGSSSKGNEINVSVAFENVVAGAIVPSSSGWIASLGNAPISGPANPFAAAFAAALAAGAVFKKTFSEYISGIGTAGTNDELSVSLLDFSSKTGADEELTKVEIGDVAFVGLGAVGNAAIWTLGCLDELNGQAWLVDHELIELSNLQRYSLSLDGDDLKSLPKTIIAERALLNTSLALHKRQMRLHEFADEFNGCFTVPTICVSVDNYQDRRVTQTLLPRLVVNGYTGKTDIGASWHRIGDFTRQCLACLYRGERSKSTLDKMAGALGLTIQEVATLFQKNAMLSEVLITKIEHHHDFPSSTLKSWVGKHINEVYSDLICGHMSMQTSIAREEIVPLAHQSAMAGVLMGSELVKRTSANLEKRSQSFEQVTWGNIMDPPPTSWGQTSPATSACICRDPDYISVYQEKWEQQPTIPPTISAS